jgi:hypothetical protein
MVFPKTALCCAAIAWSGSLAFAGESKDKTRDEENKAAVTVPVSAAGNDEGFRLCYPHRISASSARPVKFPVHVGNLLKEEVFLEVEGHDDPSYAIENDDAGRPLLMGGSVVGFPDNANLLKRLHA